MKLWIFASAVLLVSWVFIGGYIVLTRKPIQTITLPAFEVEHDTKQVVKMGWGK